MSQSENKNLLWELAYKTLENSSKHWENHLKASAFIEQIQYLFRISKQLNLDQLFHGLTAL